MNEVSQELDGEVVMRWLGERYCVLLGELTGLLDVEAGLTSVVGEPSYAS
ncbi:hypothetical protein [Streptomyces olivoreticuli]|nr:hypothetical protein [Streptomyces olivoreticuli]